MPCKIKIVPQTDKKLDELRLLAAESDSKYLAVIVELGEGVECWIIPEAFCKALNRRDYTHRFETPKGLVREFRANTYLRPELAEKIFGLDVEFVV